MSKRNNTVSSSSEFDSYSGSEEIPEQIQRPKFTQLYKEELEEHRRASIKAKRSLDHGPRQVVSNEHRVYANVDPIDHKPARPWTPDPDPPSPAPPRHKTRGDTQTQSLQKSGTHAMLGVNRVEQDPTSASERSVCSLMDVKKQWIHMPPLQNAMYAFDEQAAIYAIRPFTGDKQFPAYVYIESIATFLNEMNKHASENAAMIPAPLCVLHILEKTTAGRARDLVLRHTFKAYVKQTKPDQELVLSIINALLVVFPGITISEKMKIKAPKLDDKNIRRHAETMLKHLRSSTKGKFGEFTSTHDTVSRRLWVETIYNQVSFEEQQACDRLYNEQLEHPFTSKNYSLLVKEMMRGYANKWLTNTSEAIINDQENTLVSRGKHLKKKLSNTLRRRQGTA